MKVGKLRQALGLCDAVFAAMITAVVGVSEFAFDFFNEGGTNNLLPGRSVRGPTLYTQTN
jgi:hypothetical protein